MEKSSSSSELQKLVEAIKISEVSLFFFPKSTIHFITFLFK